MRIDLAVGDADVSKSLSPELNIVFDDLAPGLVNIHRRILLAVAGVGESAVP